MAILLVMLQKHPLGQGEGCKFIMLAQPDGDLSCKEDKKIVFPVPSLDWLSVPGMCWGYTACLAAGKRGVQPSWSGKSSNTLLFLGWRTRWELPLLSLQLGTRYVLLMLLITMLTRPQQTANPPPNREPAFPTASQKQIHCPKLQSR